MWPLPLRLPLCHTGSCILAVPDKRGRFHHSLAPATEILSKTEGFGKGFKMSPHKVTPGLCGQDPVPLEGARGVRCRAGGVK